MSEGEVSISSAPMARFDCQFVVPHIELSFYRGWFQRFAELCIETDKLLGLQKRGFHRLQLIEEFGSARCCWNIDVRSDRQDEDAQFCLWLSELVGRAEEATAPLRIANGQEGHAQLHSRLWHRWLQHRYQSEEIHCALVSTSSFPGHGSCDCKCIFQQSIPPDHRGLST